MNSILRLCLIAIVGYIGCIALVSFIHAMCISAFNLWKEVNKKDTIISCIKTATVFYIGMGSMIIIFTILGLLL